MHHIDYCMGKTGGKGRKGILVAGDAMLDAYHFGKVDRISPEAPVPVFLETGREKYVPGGAANVAVNIAAIGIPVSLCAAVGDDPNGKTFLRLMEENHVDTTLVMETAGRKTTTKLRYIGPGSQQILRVDDEDAADIADADARAVLETVGSALSDYCLIVLSDYKKGFLSGTVARGLISMANERGIPVLVDVKDPAFSKYGNATVLKPNRKELRLLTGMPVSTEEEIAEAAKSLCLGAPCEYVLATLGAGGMILVGKNGTISRLKSAANEVFDVTGAGDTSIAYLAAEMACGKDVKEAMAVANYAAGIQVSKAGTSVVHPYEVYEAMKGAGLEPNVGHGVSAPYDMIDGLCKRKARGEKIVFTNGCFDILHRGHVTYLREAKKLGDILVIGLNSDESVRRLKGGGRPVNSLEDREEMLSSLSFVDYVIPFDEDTPIRLIESILPDVLVKGGDYSPQDIVGAEAVLQNGGEVKVIPFVDGYSTTGIIDRMQGVE